MGGERERRRPESGRSPRGAGRHKCPATPRLHSDTAPSPAPPQPLPPTADCLQIQIPESAPPVPGCLLASLPVAAARQGGGDAGGRGRVTGTHTQARPKGLRGGRGGWEGGGSSTGYGSWDPRRDRWHHGHHRQGCTLAAAAPPDRRARALATQGLRAGGC